TARWPSSRRPPFIPGQDQTFHRGRQGELAGPRAGVGALHLARDALREQPLQPGIFVYPTLGQRPYHPDVAKQPKPSAPPRGLADLLYHGARTRVIRQLSGPVRPVDALHTSGRGHVELLSHAVRKVVIEGGRIRIGNRDHEIIWTCPLQNGARRALRIRAKSL